MLPLQFRSIAIHIALLLATSTLALLTYSCEPESEEVTPTTPYLQLTDVRGVVLSESGDPLPYTTVNCHAKSTTTDDYGYFELHDVWAVNKRVILEVTKFSHFTQRTAVAYQGKNTFATLKIRQQTNFNFLASNGNEIEWGDTKVIIPPDAVMVEETGEPYSGTVACKATYFDPMDENFGFLMPGGDFAGIDEEGEEVFLYSYGAITVELLGGGNELNLLPGQTAILEIAVPSSMLADAPSTIPLWYFDEENALWLEEGEAELIDGKYIGEVSHFSSWNCDDPIDPTTFVKGQIVNEDGEPYAGVPIHIGPLNVTSDENGDVISNVANGFNFLIAQYMCPESSIYVSALSSGETYDFGQMTLMCENEPLSFVIAGDDGNVIETGVIEITQSPIGYNQMISIIDGSLHVNQFVVDEFVSNGSPFLKFELTDGSGYHSYQNLIDLPSIDTLFFVSECSESISELDYFLFSNPPVCNGFETPSISYSGGEINIDLTELCSGYLSGSSNLSLTVNSDIPEDYSFYISGNWFEELLGDSYNINEIIDHELEVCMNENHAYGILNYEVEIEKYESGFVGYSYYNSTGYLEFSIDTE